MAPPLVMSLLKIVAWVDDPNRRATDLQDIRIVLRRYEQESEVRPESASSQESPEGPNLSQNRHADCRNSQRTALCCNFTYSGFHNTDSRWPGAR